MDTRKILAELRAERGRIDKAIAAIESLSSNARSVGRRGPTAAGAQAGPRTFRPRRRLSAAARKKLSAMMKARWASGKMGRAKKRA